MVQARWSTDNARLTNFRRFDKRPERLRRRRLAIISFGAMSAKQVMAGKKTLTFRKWSRATVRVGEVCDAARMGYPPQKFGRIKVKAPRRVRLKEIDDNLAKRDGARSSTETKAYWSKQGFRADDELWLMEFELVS